MTPRSPPPRLCAASQSAGPPWPQSPAAPHRPMPLRPKPAKPSPSPPRPGPIATRTTQPRPWRPPRPACRPPSRNPSSRESSSSSRWRPPPVAPTAEYSRVVNIAPSLSGDSANGPGLSETKTTLRGFSDDQYNITFDGIPWGDTNNPAHHSTSFFLAAVIGAAVVERGLGNASNLGFATFGGSINLVSKKPGTARPPACLPPWAPGTPGSTAWRGRAAAWPRWATAHCSSTCSICSQTAA